MWGQKVRKVNEDFMSVGCGSFVLFSTSAFTSAKLFFFILWFNILMIEIIFPIIAYTSQYYTLTMIFKQDKYNYTKTI